jgi:membrane protease YdiL (CAAX protease family)
MLRQGGGVALKETPLKALGQILLYLVATVLIGALLAPPLYWMAHTAAGHLHSARLDEFLTKTDFERFFHRAVMIAALVLLLPLLRALRIENFGHDLGLARDRRGWKRLAAGFLLALVSLLVLGAILFFTGIYRLHSYISIGKLAWLPVTALTVSVLEEILFRGALQGVVRKTTVDDFAMVMVAVLFAVVHFLSPQGTEPAAIHWWSGLALLPDTLSQFRQPALLLGGFTTLLLVGLILGYARERTRSLWMPVGLHAGWVLGKMGLMDACRHSAVWPWVGPDVLTGLAPLLTLLLTWGIVWLMLRDV